MPEFYQRFPGRRELMDYAKVGTGVGMDAGCLGWMQDAWGSCGMLTMVYKPRTASLQHHTGASGWDLFPPSILFLLTF